MIRGVNAMPKKASFTVATYNVLAGAYIQRPFYPRTPALVLNPAWRIPAVVQRVMDLKAADLICLQEVEPEVFASLRASLGMLGYSGQFARKRGGRPDGCAIFYRLPVKLLLEAQTVAFADGSRGEADSGNIALIILFEMAGRRLGIINTHLTWDPPGTPLSARLGYRQASQLLLEYRKIAPSGDAWILAGDFNAVPDDDMVGMIEQAGFHYAHQDDAGANTCSFNGQAKMIDYLFYSSKLRAEPEPPSPLDERTVLPSAEQPSDHVPVLARMEWYN
jgi:mRNA deadenylase 3'-5' endonuclease subunit Ccr4